MKFKSLILSVFVAIIPLFLAAETYTVILEPLPPFINPGFVKSSNPGFSIVFLKQIEKQLGDTFKFSEAPYSRLKWGLKEKKYDLVGHMPYKLEVKEFYTYAQDVDWSIDVISDIYVVDKANLSKIKSLRIGTPRGNKEFASELTGIPLKNFYDSGTIESLLGMLYKGRIDAFWFPRSTTMPFIKKSGNKVYYKQFPDFTVPVCFSVQNNAKGTALKKRLEAEIAKINTKELFSEIHKFNSLPAEGEIN